MGEKQPTNTSAATYPGEAEDLFGRLAKTREVMKLAGGIVSRLLVMLETGSQKEGPIRRAAIKTAGKIINRSILSPLSDRDAIEKAPAIKTVASDPGFAQLISKQMTETSNVVIGLLADIAKEYEKLETEEKKKLLESFLGNTDTEKSAKLLTSCFRIINDIHADEPEFLARVLAPGFERWIASMDFGELKEMVDSGAKGISALARMTSDVMGDYPAKAVSLLSLAPTLVNIATDALAQSLENAGKSIAPDMAADVIRSMLLEIDTNSISRMVNGMAEMTRRIHVGSALLGEPGSPEFPKAFTDIARNIVEGLDHEILWKARTAMAEAREEVKNAVSDAVAENPDMMAGDIATRTAVTNAGIRAASRRAAALEAQPPETIDEAMAKAMAGLDVQEIAEIINIYATLFNRMLAASPGILSEKIDAFADSLDVDEISDLLETVGQYAGNALLSIARSAVPHIAKGFFSALAPGNGPSENIAKEARDLMASLLKNGEVDHE